MALNLSGKPILIVEDYPVMRKAIRNMLQGLGADFIIEADNGINAINAMGKQSFEVVLCDYNLGNGKNGQQVLEEARHRKLIPYQCVFIIISAEQTTSMVLGAMDNKPDEYLTKPFNTQQLLTRLERNFARKAYLASVEQEIERGNLMQAMANCDRLLAENNKKMQTPLLKLRAELAINTGDFKRAKQIYHDILAERELPWARMGLGIADYYQGNLNQAIECFQALLKENPLFMEAYDWLTKTYEQLDQHHDAQQILHHAVDLSPQSLLRQKKLAETADKNGNFEVATQAYKATVDLAKHSVHKSPTDFVNLAKLYAKTNAGENALQTLEAMRGEYLNNPEAELRASTLEAEVHQSLGDGEKASQAFERALELSQQLDNRVPKDVQLDLAKACFLNDQTDRANKILDRLIKGNIDDDQFLNDIRRMQSSIGLHNHSEVLIEKTKQALVAANNQAVALYKQGRFHEALALLEETMANMPDNKTIVVNMLKIIIHDLKVNPIDGDKMRRGKLLLKKAHQIGVEPHKLSVLQQEFVKTAQAKAPQTA